MEVSQPIPISFEFFPPKASQGLISLLEKAKQLQTWQPGYFSVTFGAFGASQINTLHVVQELVNLNLEIAPHMTCIGLTRETIRTLLQNYKDLGIRRLVVLRGDLPQGHTNKGDFEYGYQLVEFIRKETGSYFYIEVAAYPEFHPQAFDVHSDLKAFKQKVEAGSNSAITQYFYNVEAYFQFLESCDKLNISIPIIPGIMPIRNYQQLRRFSEMCGADLPLWLDKRLQAFGDDEMSVRQYGLEVVLRLCEDLCSQGVPGLHFYTLNELEPTASLLRLLGLEQSSAVKSVEELII